jgi:3'-phosphoadenosine 5'-phosphosulfate sulfotransferase (PAPS reductase)/FAD synthetase
MESLGQFYYQKVLPAAQIIKTCQHIYTDIYLAYNGGKDCTVLLELIEYFNIDIPVVVFSEPDTFPILTHFTKSRLLNSKVRKIFLSPDIKLETTYLVQQGLKAIVLGERFTDPGQPRSYISDSTPGWAKYKIINPIFDWTYHDVWFFLDGIKAEYCELYRQGYTSIGSEVRTRVNSKVAGRHARELMNPLEERIGRI